MLIAFEGIESSGKTTLSVGFEQYLNSRFKSSDGTLKLDPHLGEFIWTKELTLSTEDAERLNSPDYYDEYSRERTFFESRRKHQDIVMGRNAVCDRYLWSGLAYAYLNSPHCYDLLRELYLSESLFIQPDLYIFVDTPFEICHDRNPVYGLEHLRALRGAYSQSRKYIQTPVLSVQSVGGEEHALEYLVAKFDEYVQTNGLVLDASLW